MYVKEVAGLVNISIRTLHHYDEIGLLSPSTKENGYRYYSDEDLQILQQILFFKELGFSLKRIKSLIKSPGFDRLEALELQRKALIEKKKRTEMMLETIERTIKQAKGEIEMTREEAFQGFDFGNNPYEEEARQKFGDQAIDDSNKKIQALGKEGQQEISEAMETIFKKLAKVMEQDPESQDVQQLIGEWFSQLNQVGTYSYEAFAGLGELYVMDERFTNNIDKYGTGLAQFMRDAMRVYAENQR